jgi:hypothetical protein
MCLPPSDGLESLTECRRVSPATVRFFTPHTVSSSIACDFQLPEQRLSSL